MTEYTAQEGDGKVVDVENVIKAYKFCKDNEGTCDKCVYFPKKSKLFGCPINNDMLSAIREQQAEIDRLKAEQPKWVSVSERLPEEKISPITHDYTEVVCYTSFGDVRVYKFGDCHFYKGQGIMDHIVTHWQYLPTPPKDGEQE